MQRTERTEPKLAYSVPEAADLIGLSERTVWELVASKRLVTVKYGRRRLVRYSDLVAYVESLEEAA